MWTFPDIHLLGAHMELRHYAAGDFWTALSSRYKKPYRHTLDGKVYGLIGTRVCGVFNVFTPLLRSPLVYYSFRTSMDSITRARSFSAARAL